MKTYCKKTKQTRRYGVLSSFRLFPIGLILIIFLFNISCSRFARSNILPSHAKPKKGEGQRNEMPGLIAFTAADGNLYLIDPGGKRLVALTDDADPSGSFMKFYRYASWSHDGTQVAFLGYTAREDGLIESILYTASVSNFQPEAVYRTVHVTPFYLYWSPDGSTISMLCSTNVNRDLVLILVPSEGGEVQTLDAGQPFYWVWSPNSMSILAHIGGRGRSDSVIKRYDLISGRPEEKTLDFFPSFFQAPLFSPGGEYALISAELYQGWGTLTLLSSDDQLKERFTSWNGPLAFDWSMQQRTSGESDRQGTGLLAVLNGTYSPFGGIIGKLSIVETEENRKNVAYQVDSEHVIAFFWSPNGKNIAYFEPTVTDDPEGENALMLNLWVLDIEGQENRLVYSFQPTMSFVGQMIPYFDQYQRSHSIWSPDSSSLVVNALTDDTRPGVFIVPSEVDKAPQLIAYGILPFWSWR
jgi:hypothetical protein